MNVSACLHPTHAHRAVRSFAGPALSPGGVAARCSPWSVALPSMPSAGACSPCSALRRYYSSRPTAHDVHVGRPAQGLHRPARRASAPADRRSVLPLSRVGPHACLGAQLRRVLRELAMAFLPVLPSAIREQRRHSGRDYFAARCPSLHCPCQRFYGSPSGSPRMTRGRDDSLLLSHMTLSFTTTTPVSASAPQPAY